MEISPMARALIVRCLPALGLRATLRSGDSGPFITDNGNVILDVALAAPLADGRAARALQARLREIPGIVDTGLFLGTAEHVLVGRADGRVDVLTGDQADSK